MPSMTDDKLGNTRALDAINARGLTAKREYVRGLEQRRDAEAISLLVECLCDESSYLRGLAEEAFFRMGEEQAHVLVPLLGQGLWYTRASAARVLGRMGFRPAVPGLLALAEDANEAVRAAACDALVALAHARGGARLAHAIHRLPPDLRRRRMADLAGRDRPLAERLDRLMSNDELMQLEPIDTYGDDHPAVRTSEEGVEWEILTGPPPPPRPPGAPGHGDRDS
jgi:hypothetical protein